MKTSHPTKVFKAAEDTLKSRSSCRKKMATAFQFIPLYLVILKDKLDAFMYEIIDNVTQTKEKPSLFHHSGVRVWFCSAFLSFAASSRQFNKVTFSTAKSFSSARHLQYDDYFWISSATPRLIRECARVFVRSHLSLHLSLSSRHLFSKCPHVLPPVFPSLLSYSR